MAREEPASSRTELHSADTSCHSDSNVTEDDASPTAPPLTVPENHSTAEETRDATISSSFKKGESIRPNRQVI